ncbi:Hsp20 family protein [Halapricum sp. CBA1109]|uniref:Hsp20/alpha crystallin family protein n=1 Tax=Halapricum sp. CBA1109 TaxID=2668068 RepID=UPI0012FB81AA|nr:Hsp20/alpha crystallin family protein [Halapricum sp. CBA1109]MUV90638.1 Hsp20 family protein [Halapricum sp. CBA1109]
MSPGSSPFDDIERLFDRMSDQFEALDPADLGVPVTPLPVDVVDEGDAFVVRADLAGYDAEDIDVSLPAARTVRIDAVRETAGATGGKRRQADERGETEGRVDDEDDGVIIRSERSESVQRSVSLPEAVERNATEATYDDGVLEIRLPKEQADDGVSVPVN